jgi:hypothetical protein
MMRPTRVIRAATLLLPLTLLLGCTPSPTATTVDVTLLEWAVVVDDTSVPTGEITFSVTNDGPNDVHRPQDKASRVARPLKTPRRPRGHRPGVKVAKPRKGWLPH